MYEFALLRMRETGMRAATVATGADAKPRPGAPRLRESGFWGADSPRLDVPRAIVDPCYDHLQRYGNHQASVESDWVDWMTRVHVPDVLRTGCFSDCRLCKVLGSEGEQPSYVLQYHALQWRSIIVTGTALPLRCRRITRSDLPESSVVLDRC